MAQLLPPIPKEPIEPNSHVWREWFNSIRNVIVGTAQGVISWASLNFDGSNITDIVTRNHNNLQTIQGGTANQYYHLTATQLTNLGTVTTVSVATSNGFAGTVANATSTPVITLSTSITGLLKGNGTAISAATSGTDYAPATSGTSILYGNGSGGFSNVTIGSGVSFTTGTLSATGSGGTITSVTGTAPVASSGGTTPVISMAAATTSVDGYLTSTDWTTFNNKGSGTVTSVSGTAGRVSSTGGTTPVIDLVSGIASAGTTGSASLIPVVTIDTYGRVTSITTAANPQGTVTSVAAITLGTTGTDLSSTVATGTTTPVITLQVPTASASNRGALSATDWTTFNNKGSGTITSVTGTAPVVSSGGTTPAISMAAATTSVSGYLTSTDWNTFNGKQPAGSYLVSGGALGTPSSGTVTNLTGTASININGTVGATTPAAGAFTSGTFSTTLGVTGLASVGAGGTGSVTADLNINGSNASGYGSTLTFKQNSVANGQLGQIGAILGTSSQEMGYLSRTGHQWLINYSATIGMTLASTGALTIPGTLGVSTGAAVGGATPGAGGLAFPATAVAVVDVNTLDDYNEGTFSPTVYGGTTAGTTTYAAQRSGYYTKIGRMIFFQMYVKWTAQDGTGDMLFGGFPAGDSLTYSYGSLAIGFIDSIALTAGKVPIAYIATGATPTAYLYQTPTGGGAAAAVPIDSAGEIMLSGFYMGP